jgi:hypothetical protein
VADGSECSCSASGARLKLVAGDIILAVIRDDQDII